ncbi:unnamed protein product [Amoebophrya sp. A25]|nr:unnamed protein product [Amoebophrya sp. A25]|eukprot:GSA25T00024822001.1
MRMKQMNSAKVVGSSASSGGRKRHQNKKGSALQRRTCQQDHVGGRAPCWSLRNLAVCANAFAQVGIHHQRLFDIISQEVPQVLDSTNTAHGSSPTRIRQLTMLLHAYGKLKLSRDPLLHLLWASLSAEIAQIESPQSLCLLLQCYTKTADDDDATRQQLMSCFADRIAKMCDETELQATSASKMSPLSIATLAYCLHKGQSSSGGEHPRSTSHAVWASLAQLATKRFMDTRGSEIANLSVALGGKEDVHCFFDAVKRNLAEYYRGQQQGGTADLVDGSVKVMEKGIESLGEDGHGDGGGNGGIKRRKSRTSMLSKRSTSSSTPSSTPYCSYTFQELTFLELCKLADGLGQHQQPTQEDNDKSYTNKKQTPPLELHAAHGLIDLLSKRLLQFDSSSTTSSSPSRLPIIPYRNLLKSMERLQILPLSDDLLQAVSQKIALARRRGVNT